MYLDFPALFWHSYPMAPNRAARCVLACVQERVEGSARLLGRSGPGPVVVVDIAGFPHRFVPLWAGEGFPRDVKIAVRMVEDPGDDGAASVVVAASALSAGARQWLDGQGIGWADETGAYHLTGPGLDVRSAAPGASAAEGEGPAWRWSASHADVAEFLATIGVQGLSKISQEMDPDLVVTAGEDSVVVPAMEILAGYLPWSMSQVGRVLQHFDWAGWTVKQGGLRGPGAQRWLVDPSGLLSAWAGWHAAQPLDVYTRADSADLVRVVTDSVGPRFAGNQWCATGLLAKAILDRTSASPASVEILVSEEVDLGEIIKSPCNRLRLVPPAQANVRLIRSAPHLVSAAVRTYPVPTAAAPRVYADLLRPGVCTATEAEAFRTRHIRF